jgi:NitT/TauT family transport system substrate-binding protein
MSSRVLIACIALTSLALSGCSRSEHARTKSAAPGTPVTMNINPTISYAPLVIAKDEGFFAAEGIDARLVSLDSNSAVTAAAAGKLDVLSVGVRSGIFNMILRGAPLQVVADRAHTENGMCDAEAFIAPVGMVKRIAAAGGSLRGEHVGMVRGGVAEFLTELLLAQRHVTMHDVIPVQLPQGSATSARDGLEVVHYVGEPPLSNALSEGWAGVVATSNDVAPHHQTSLLVYGKHLLHDDPDLGRRFMRAYLRGVRRYNEGKSERNVAIISRYTKLPPATVRRACWIAISNDGRIDPGAIQPFLDWALAKHYIDAPVPLASWWNPSFVDAAGQQLAHEVR